MKKLRQQATESIPAKVRGAELAKILGLSKSRITRLKEAGVLMVDEAGTYALVSSVRSYIGFLKSGSTDNNSSVAGARTDYLVEQRRRLKLRNDTAEGEIILRADVQWAIGQWTSLSNAAWDTLPARCAPLLAGVTDQGTIRAILLTEVRAVRGEISRALEQQARDSDAPGLQPKDGRNA